MKHSLKNTILTAELRQDQDIVLIRQRTRQIVELMGFDVQDQTRIATAVSEIARNAYEYADGCHIEFKLIDGSQQTFQVIATDRRGEISDGSKDKASNESSPEVDARFADIGVQHLMDEFAITSTAKHPGTNCIRIVMSKHLPTNVPRVTPKRLTEIANELARNAPGNTSMEVHQQNRELIRALDALRARQEELTRLNQELEDTNRGVVALYAELDDKAVALKLANEAKTRFYSEMSHEFRTPLSAIVSLSRMLLEREDGPLTQEQEQQINFIRRSAEDLVEMVSDLLDLAKVEAGKMIVRTSVFEVSELFRALRGTLRSLSTRSSTVDLIFEEVPAPLIMTSDEGKISQILRNLISNALKYTEQGVVRVSATCKDEDQVVFVVSDTGIGIAQEDLDRIFSEFVQVNNALQARVKATGLGLPVTRKLAHLLGGTVSVESRQGVGSTFRVTLPRNYEGPSEIAPTQDHIQDHINVLEATTPQVPTAVSAPPTETVNAGASEHRLETISDTTNWILIIDDDEASRYVIGGALKRLGFSVVEAQDGAEGIHVARQIQPRAILLDIVMPGMDGITVLEYLKADPDLKNIPVIVDTSLNLHMDVILQTEILKQAVAILAKDEFAHDTVPERLISALQTVGVYKQIDIKIDL